MSLGLKLWDSSGRKTLDMSDFTVRLVFIAPKVAKGRNYDSRCTAGMIAAPLPYDVLPRTPTYTPEQEALFASNPELRELIENFEGLANYDLPQPTRTGDTRYPYVVTGNGFFDVLSPAPGYEYSADVAVAFMVFV